MKNSKLYWTKERCKEVAIQFNTKSEFMKNYLGAYESCLNNNWLGEVCEHMLVIQRPSGYWTYENCKEEALKYTTMNDFRHNGKGAYNAAHKNKWTKEITSHMIKTQKPTGYWTYENCKNEALKYKNKSEFIKMSGGAYESSRDNKWLDEICSHMKILGNLLLRLVYAYEFSDNYVYIGLTCNEIKRNNQHFITGPVHNHTIITKLNPIKKILTDGYVSVVDAVKLEGFYVEKYKNEGWNILNKAKTGAVGTNKLIWTKEKCQEEALKYDNRSIFSKMSNGAYDSAHRHKWLDEICSHIIQLRKPNNYWTKEKCQEEALKYDNRSDFYNNSKAYDLAHRHKWLDEICSHMIQIRKPNGYWTYEKCKEEALKYNNRREFNEKSSSAYNVVYENKWLDELTSHMKLGQKSKGYWSFENCKNEALKYNNRTNFQKSNPGAYHSARKNKWLEIICLHMN